MPAARVAALVASVFITLASAADPYEIKDINTQASAWGSSPTNFVVLNGKAYFAATDNTTGTELWSSDGTAAGTVLVKDLWSGAGNGAPQSMAVVNGTIWFCAGDGVNGFELWKSDGTTAGTVLVKDIGPGAGSGFPNGFAAVGTKVVFAASGSDGSELWITDGTSAGTVEVKDINPGSASSSPTGFVSVNGVVYFTATDGTHGTELWKTDGTSAGTVLVSDIVSGSGSSSPQNLTAFGTKLLFSAADGSGREPWISDGTSAGTVRIADINAGSGSSSPSGFLVSGSLALFSADDGTHGAELWKTDGTSAGTALVLDINAGSAASSPVPLWAASGTVYFRATTASAGTELWKTDGTAAGTVQVVDLNAGTASSTPSVVAQVGATTFLAATTASNGTELWKTDGTSAGTVLVKDINAGTANSSPSVGCVLGTTVLFAADNGSVGSELWSSDGTTAGTALVKDIRGGTADSYTWWPPSFTLFNGKAIFSATDGLTGFEPWITDGTASGTFQLKDINAGGSHSSPSNFCVVGSIAYFQAGTSSNGFELWKTDGTAAGTVQVLDAAPQWRSSSPNNLVALGSQLLYAADDNTNGSELWTSDGTAAGTSMLKDINPGAGASSPSGMVKVSSTCVVFAANDGTHGSELWKTDGTAAGTSLVLDIASGTVASSPTNFVVFNGYAYFSANDGVNGTELWRTDGTASGTTLVKDINPGAGSSSPSQLVVGATRLYFVANDGTHGAELWMSDGTSAGTTLVKDIVTGTGNPSIAGLIVTGDRAVFAANDGTHGLEPWTSDGTSAGTTLITDIIVGSGSSSPSSFCAHAGDVYFDANDGVHGNELWKWTPGGGNASLVADINQNATNFGGSNASFLTSTPFGLLFYAQDGIHGMEPWLLPTSAPPTVAFTTSSAGFPESTSPAVLTVALNAASSQTVTVPYSVTGGTATGGGVDYTLANGSLTFSAGVTTQTISIPIVNDTLYEADETIIVSLGTPTNATLGATTTFTYTIQNDDQTPTVAFTAASDSHVESSSPAVMTVALSAAAGVTVTVPYSVTGGTATGGGVDYTLANGSLTFSAGVTTQTISIPIVNDAIHEPSETIVVGLGTPTNATLGAITSFTYTILDDDPNQAPTVHTAARATPNPVTGTTTALSVLGDDDLGEAQLTYTWTTTGTPPAAVSFSPNGTNAAKSSTATFTKAGSYSLLCTITDGDGASVTSPVTVIVNQTATSVVVTPSSASVQVGGTASFSATAGDQFGNLITAFAWATNGGGTISSSGLFTATTIGGPFTITATGGGANGTASVTVGVQPSASFASSSMAVTEANHQVLLPISLSSAAGAGAGIAYAVTGGTASPGADFSLPADRLSIPTGATTAYIPLSILDDSVSEPDETIVITLSSSTNLTLGAATTCTVTITDDDITRISFVNASSSGSEATTFVRIRVALTVPSAETITVPWTATDGSSGTLSFAAGETAKDITLTVVDDSTPEPDRTVTVTLGTPTGRAALGAITTHTYTIIDDDGTGTAPAAGLPQFSPTPGGYVSGVDVTLTGAPALAQVWYTTDGSTPAKNGATSTLANGVVHITASTTFNAISVTTVGASSSTSAVATATYSIGSVSSYAFGSNTPSGSGFAISPVCLEATGSTKDKGVVARIVSNGQLFDSPAVVVLDENHYYADFPLPTTGNADASFSVSDRSGTSTAFTKTLHWDQTDLRVANNQTFVLRVGDSLLLTGTSSDGSGNALSIDPGNLASGQQQLTAAPGSTFACAYPQPGIFTATATIDGAAVGSIIVKVALNPLTDHSVIAAELGFDRPYTATAPGFMDVLTFNAVDPAYLLVTLGAQTYNSSELLLRPLQRGTPMLLARINGAGGAIIGHLEVQEFKLELDDLVGWTGPNGVPTFTSEFNPMTPVTIIMRPYLPPSYFTSGSDGFVEIADPATKEQIGILSMPSLDASVTSYSNARPMLQQIIDGTATSVTLAAPLSASVMRAQIQISTPTDDPVFGVPLTRKTGDLYYNYWLSVTGTVDISGTSDAAAIGRLSTRIFLPDRNPPLWSGYTSDVTGATTHWSVAGEIAAAGDTSGVVIGPAEQDVMYTPPLGGGDRSLSSATRNIFVGSSPTYGLQEGSGPFTGDPANNGLIFLHAQATKGTGILVWSEDHFYGPGRHMLVNADNPFAFYVYGIHDIGFGFSCMDDPSISPQPTHTVSYSISRTHPGTAVIRTDTGSDQVFLAAGDTTTLSSLTFGPNDGGQVIDDLGDFASGKQFQFRGDFHKDDEIVLTAISSLPTAPVAKKVLRKYTLGKGVPTQLAARVSLIPSFSTLNAGSGNMCFSAPIRVYRTPDPGPDLVLSYNSMDLSDAGLGDGWRSNWDLRVAEASGPSVLPSYIAPAQDLLLVDEAGRRISLSTGGLLELKPILTTNYSDALGADHAGEARGDFRAGEYYKVDRRDNRLLYFNKDGWLVRSASLAGDSITVTRNSDNVATNVVDERHPERALDLVALLHAGSSGNRINAVNDGYVGESPTWSFQYDSNGNMTSATVAGDAGHGTLQLSPTSSQQVFTFSYQTGADNVDRCTGVTYGSGLTTSIAYAVSVTNGIGTVTSATVTDALGGITQYPHLDTESWTDMTDAAGVAHHRTITTTTTGATLQQQDGPAITTSTYDSVNHLVEQTKAYGTPGTLTTRWTWGDLGIGANVLLEQREAGVVIDAYGNTTDIVTSSEYGTVGRQAAMVTSTTDPCGNKTLFKLDSDGHVVSWTDVRGQVWTVTDRDVYGHQKTVLSPAGRKTVTAYDTYGVVTSTTVYPETTASVGLTTTYDLDAAERVTAVHASGGVLTTTSYDPLGRVTIAQDEQQRKTSTTYDALGRVVDVQHIAGPEEQTAAETTAPPAAQLSDDVTTYVHEAGGTWLMTTTRTQGTSTLQVAQSRTDAAGRLVDSIDLRSLVNGSTTPTACATHHSYDSSSGYETSVTDPRGNNTYFVNDLFGRRLETTTAAGIHTVATINALGWVVSDLDGDGFTTSYVNDACGRRVRTINPLGEATESEYDAAGVVVATRGPIGAPVQTLVDPDGAVVGSIDRFGVERHSAVEASDGQLQQRSWRDSSGASTVVALDARGLQSSVTTSIDGTAYPATTLTTRDDGTVRQAVSPLGARTETAVDGLGRPRRSERDAIIDGAIKQLASTTGYDANSGIATSGTGQLGLDTQTTINVSTGDVDQTNSDADGTMAPNEGVVSRDANGNVLVSGQFTSSGSAPQLTTTRVYDADNRLTSSTAPDGVNTTWNYVGTRLHAMTRAGVTTTYTYDALGRTTQVAGPGPTQVTVYGVGGLVMSTTTGTGSQTRTVGYVYDPVTLAQVEEDGPSGRVVKTEYDSAGRRSATIDPDTGRTAFAYDALDRLTTTTFSDSTTEARTYAADGGELATLTERDGKQSTFSYDHGQLTGKSVADHGTTTSIAYALQTDPAAPTIGLKRLTTLGGGTVTTRLDRAGRVAEYVQPSGDSVATVYDRAGRLGSKGDIGYSYDSAGHLTQLTQTGGVTAGITYDARGRVQTYTLPNGLTRTYGYDDADRVASMTEAFGLVTETWTITRDPIGHITSVAASDHAEAYSYDGDRLSRDQRTGVGAATTLFAYDANDNRIASSTFPSPAAQLCDFGTDLGPVQPQVGTWTITSGLALSASGTGTLSATLSLASGTDQTGPDLIATVAPTTPNSGTTLAGFAVAAGSTTYRAGWQTRLNGLSVESRLVIQSVVGTTVTDLASTAWAADATGVRTLTVTQFPDERLEAHAVNGSALDDVAIPCPGVGRLPDHAAWSLVVAGATSGQAVGATFDDVQWTVASTRTLHVFTYGALDRLDTDAETTDGASSSSASTTYTYDSNGRCTTRTRTPSGGSAATTQYVYDALNRLIEVDLPSGWVGTYAYSGDSSTRTSSTANGVSTTFVTDGNHAVSETTSGVTTRYLHNGSTPLAQTTGGDIVSYQFEANGNVRGLLGSTGVYRSYRYDAFGNSVLDTNVTPSGYSVTSMLDTGPRYRGLWSDGEGLYKTMTRAYAPDIGRFTELDPIRAGTNWYAYCGGDPVNRSDPTGLWWLLQYQIQGENDTPPLFTIEHDGVQIGARWVPEPGMPNAPNPKGWQEYFQSGAGALDDALVASPTGAIGLPANHPVAGFNSFDFGAADAASGSDVFGYLFTGGESSYRYLHRNDRESYALQAALQADPTLAHRLVNGAFTAMFGAEAIGAALPVVAPALGSGLVSAGSSLASAARAATLATRVALGGNVLAATYVIAPTATAATILGGEVLSGLTGAPSPTAGGIAAAEQVTARTLTSAPASAAENRLIAFLYYRSKGFTAEQSIKYIRGIDFSRPVRGMVLGAGTPLQQYQQAGKKLGSYFAVPGTPASGLGIPVEGQIAHFYTAPTSANALESTAGDVMVDWVRGVPPFAATGGEGQWFSPQMRQALIDEMEKAAQAVEVGR